MIHEHRMQVSGCEALKLLIDLYIYSFKLLKRVGSCGGEREKCICPSAMSSPISKPSLQLKTEDSICAMVPNHNYTV